VFITSFPVHNKCGVISGMLEYSLFGFSFVSIFCAGLSFRL